MFTVGAVTSTGASSSFSSHGPNALGVIKPDGSARGTSTVMGYNNSVTTSSGTSFATPLAAGGVACLIQAAGNKPLSEVANILRQTASLYPSNNPQLGWGILNFGQAYNNITLATGENAVKSSVKIYPNPATDIFTIDTADKIISVELFNTLGQKVQTFKAEKVNPIEKLSSGVYFVKIQTDKGEVIEKLVKK
ncbi:hypothetical protein SDC9_185086 [bioreactor metagenome]|uniref:Uncharacterized protein n=1 Tax=bioreactor metagenome TaxID=1076179 RepID=A0A645HG74_9ZZZZ